MSPIRVFQIALSGGGREKIPVVLGEWEILLGLDFLSGGRRLRRGTFDHSRLFQSKIEHQLKSKLV